jgi:hypothetical protein
LSGVSKDVFMASAAAQAGFIDAIEESISEGSVTISGATRRRLAVGDSAAVAFVVEIQTNDLAQPTSAYDTFVAALTASCKSGAFTNALKKSGGADVFADASVDANSLVTEVPVITNRDGGIVTDPPTSMPTTVEKSSLLRSAQVNLIIGTTVIVLLVALAGIFVTMYYVKKHSKVKPQEFTDLDKDHDGRDHDSAMPKLKTLAPPNRSFRDEEIAALSARGFHVKKCWEQKGDDTAITISSDSSRSPVYEIKVKPGQAAVQESIEAQRPALITLQSTFTVLDDSDGEQEEILDLLEQRVTPKVSHGKAKNGDKREKGEERKLNV